jgi:hypothetical protein
LHLGDGSEACFDQVGAATALGVVKVAHGFGPGLLKSIERRPFKQELTSQRSEQILSSQLQ